MNFYLRWSKTAVQWIAVFTLAAMVAINATEIGWRLLFMRGLGWVQELSIILAVSLYFLTYALIAKQGEYIRLDLVARYLPSAARCLLSTAIRLLVLAFHGLIAWYAVKAARFSALFETPALGWPETVFFVPLAVGCADIFVTELIFLVRQLRGADAREERTGILA